MTGRAKWDAWDATSTKYDEPEKVEKRYVEIAQSLGWSERVPVENPTREKQQDSSHEDSDVDLEHLSDENGPDGQSTPAGLGTSVSTIARLDEQETTDESLHGLAVSGDIAGLTLLLDKSPELDLNSLDEFVGQRFIWQNNITLLIFRCI